MLTNLLTIVIESAARSHTLIRSIAQISDESNEIWFSVASVWEMGIKVGLGKLPLPEPIDRYLASRMKELGARSLEIRADHAIQAGGLPLHHRDPFDRMLIAQAQVEGMTIVTADRMFDLYEVEILWND